MSQYMLLVYEEEVEAAEQAEREHVTPMLLELHASLREAGYLIFNEGYGVGTRCGEEFLEACPNRASCCDVLLRQLERRWQ